MMRCHKCGREWVTQKRVKLPGVKEACEGCSAYLHCCLNCRLYDPAVHNQCQSPTTPWVTDKENANFCDEFIFADHAPETPESGKEEQARDVLKGLFGASDEPTDNDRLKRFEDL